MIRMESKVGEQEFFTADAQRRRDAEKNRSFGLPICVICVNTLDFPIPSTTNLEAFREAFREAFHEVSSAVSRGPVWGRTTHWAWKSSQSR